MTGRTGQPSIRGREQGQKVEISKMWQKQDQDGRKQGGFLQEDPMWAEGDSWFS